MQTVTIRMTTNRSNKPGDDILSTPSMISAMDNFSCDLISNIVPNRYFPVTNRVQVLHKAPLHNGKCFLLKAKVMEVEKDGALFNVKGINPDNNTVIGDAKIQIKLVQKS